MADGHEPPSGFNDGILFLLPKKGIGTPGDTRPLSVTNAYNRIIAKGVLSCILPALIEFLHASQKGFVPGRRGEDHIKALNELFYKALELDGEELFVLFVDTQKAFDSIDHDFLLALLGHVGFPNWIVNLVRALLTNVRVNPIFGGSTSVWIGIFRGVKQGCPLSPLLFALAFDPLLVRLGGYPNLSAFGFADDLAVASKRFPSICKAMREVDLFSAASGLCLNVQKTTLINTVMGLGEVRELVRCSPWPTLNVAMSSVYLGVLMGRRVKVDDIFENAVGALLSRADSCYTAVRLMHHANRVAAYNIFMFTKLSYLINFYSIPYREGAKAMNTKVESCASRLIVNFNCAYSYVHLIQPHDRLGPSPAVRDFWAISIATLAAQADLAQWDGLTEVVPSDHLNSSLRISSHVQACGADFVTSHLLGCEREGVPVVFTASDFVRDDPRLMRRAILDRLLHVAYVHQQDESTRNALARRNLPCSQDVVDFIHAHYASAARSLAPRFRRVTFQLIFNALATHRRALVLAFKDKVARKAQPRAACLLCALPSDDILHIFGGECPVVCEARRFFSFNIKVDLSLLLF